MPKLTERDRLVDLEERQRKATEDLAQARQELRGKYLDQLRTLPLERLADRELRELVNQAIRVGAGIALPALKALPDKKGT